MQNPAGRDDDRSTHPNLPSQGEPAEGRSTPDRDSVSQDETLLHSSSWDLVRVICDTYLQDQDQGIRRPLGDYVSTVAGDARSTILRNLLHLELKRRRTTGEPLNLETLVRSVPELESVVRDVLVESLEFSRDSSEDIPLPSSPSTSRKDGALLLGKYRLLRELGRGGMGAVFEAVHLERGERVALKTLPSADPRSLHRFKREFRSMAEINHSNLIGLHSLEEDGGHWFFTMDLIDGEDFLSFVRPRGRLDVQRLRSAFAQLTAGVLALHAQHIIHRDLKPSNVMVTGEGRVIVLDFGLVLDEQGDELPRSEQMAGTPAYMAPEQALGTSISGAADWYSCGVMLYEALAGRRPFSASNIFELIQQKRSAQPPRIPPDDEVPADLVRLATDLLATDPDNRPDPLEIAGQISVSVAQPTALSDAPDGLLVGREAQLQDLSNAFESVCRKRTPGVVFVSGRSGEGKTSLVEHFLKALADRTSQVVALSGRSYDRESVPFKAIDSLIDSLASYLHRLPDQDAALLMPDDIGLLADLFPTLRRVRSVEKLAHPQPSQLDAHQVRTRAFAALRSLLNRLTRQMPLVLFADDLQWGDSDSADALTEVFRPDDGPVALFIGSFRSDEAEDSPFLRRWRDRQTEADSPLVLENVGVSSLTLEDCLQLTVIIVGQDSDRIRRRAIEFYQQTGGNPFLLVELIGCFDPASDSFRAMPIHDVIDDKLSRLPEDASPILEAISVAGHPVQLDEAASSINRADISLAVITHMRSEKLVRLIGPETETNVDTYHDKIRETVLDRMAPDHRRTLHLNLAKVIESSVGMPSESDRFAASSSDSAPTINRIYDLSYHFDAAGESSKACVYATLAGEQASRQFSQQVAANQFAIARQHVSHQDKDDRFRIHYGEGRALSLLGRYDKASRVLSELKEDALDDCHRAQVLGLQAEIAHKQGQIGDGMRLYADALRRLGYWIPKSKLGLAVGLGYEVVVQTLHTCLPKKVYRRNVAPDRERLLAIEFANRNSIVSYYNSTPRMLWTHLKGLNLAETRLPSRGLAYAFGLHPAPVAVLGMVRRGLRYSDLAIEYTKETNDLLTRGHCYAMRSMAQYAAGDYADSVENADTSIRLLNEAGDPYIIFIADVHRSFSLWRLLELKASIEGISAAFSRAVRLGEDCSAGGLLLAMASVTDGDFQFEQMRACFRVSEEDFLTASWCHFAKGLWHLRAERYSEAVESLQEAWSTAVRHLVIVPYTVCASTWLATALRRKAEAVAEDPRQRSLLLRQARKSLRPALRLSRFYVSERAHALREHGLLLHLKGRTRAGVRQLARSLEVANRQEDRWQQTLSSLELGRLQAAMGEPDAGRRVEEATAVLLRVEREIREATGTGTTSSTE